MSNAGREEMEFIAPNVAVTGGRMLTLAFALAVGERWGGAAATS